MRGIKFKLVGALLTVMVASSFSLMNGSEKVKADTPEVKTSAVEIKATTYSTKMVIKVPEKPKAVVTTSTKTTAKKSTKKYTNANRGFGEVSASTRGGQVANFALKFVGYPYVWGAEGPGAFDCSGFALYVYKHFGVSLSRTASSQYYGIGNSIYRSNLAPGDLVYFYTPVSHVGIYIGGGKFVHASNSRTGVKISSLSEGSYSSAFRGAKRIF
jgi:peptidoglycan DL-endopeptidase CwlO